MDEDDKDYTVLIGLQCKSEAEIASAMERLNLPLIGLCLDGINITFMKMSTD